MAISSRRGEEHIFQTAIVCKSSYFLQGFQELIRIICFQWNLYSFFLFCVFFIGLSDRVRRGIIWVVLMWYFLLLDRKRNYLNYIFQIFNLTMSRNYFTYNISLIRYLRTDCNYLRDVSYKLLTWVKISYKLFVLIHLHYIN